jgi:hypothetical protein
MINARYPTIGALLKGACLHLNKLAPIENIKPQQNTKNGD